MSTNTRTARHVSGLVHRDVAHSHNLAPQPDKLSVKQLSVIFLSIAAFVIAIALYSGSEHKHKAIGQTESQPATATIDQAGRLLLRP